METSEQLHDLLKKRMREIWQERAENQGHKVSPQDLDAFNEEQQRQIYVFGNSLRDNIIKGGIDNETDIILTVLAEYLTGELKS